MHALLLARNSALPNQFQSPFALLLWIPSMHSSDDIRPEDVTLKALVFSYFLTFHGQQASPSIKGSALLIPPHYRTLAVANGHGDMPFFIFAGI